MCLILLAVAASEEYPLVIAANRDEFFDRPTAAAAFWPQGDILAGRDLRQGGSWFGLTRTGRLAMVTNVRSPRVEASTRSRGHLVRDFLLSGLPAAEFARQAAVPEEEFPGFNLICGELGELWYASNRPFSLQPIPPGIHGLSNAGLDTPWPKVIEGKAALAELLAAAPGDPAPGLFALLGDTTIAADERLPDTGIEPAWERALSARFIRMPGYGTRASTLLLVDRRRRGRFIERGFGPDGSCRSEREFTLQF